VPLTVQALADALRPARVDRIQYSSEYACRQFYKLNSANKPQVETSSSSDRLLFTAMCS
jgi:hypothetical protein